MNDLTVEEIEAIHAEYDLGVVLENGNVTGFEE